MDLEASIEALLAGKTEEDVLETLLHTLDQSSYIREKTNEIPYIVLKLARTHIQSRNNAEILAALDPSGVYQKRAAWHKQTIKAKAKYLEEIRSLWGDDLSVLTDQVLKAGENRGKQLLELAKLTPNDAELRRRALNSALLYRLTRGTSRPEPEFNNTDIKNAATYAKQMLGMDVDKPLPYQQRNAEQCRFYGCVIVDGLLTGIGQAPPGVAIKAEESDSEDEEDIDVLLAEEPHNEEGEGGAVSTPKTKPTGSKDKQQHQKRTAEARADKGKGKERASPVASNDNDDSDNEIEEPVEDQAAPTEEPGPSGDCPECTFPVNLRQLTTKKYPSGKVKAFMGRLVGMCGTLRGTCRTCERDIFHDEDEMFLDPSHDDSIMLLDLGRKRPTEELPSERKRQKTCESAASASPPVASAPPPVAAPEDAANLIEELFTSTAAAPSTETSPSNPSNS